MYFYFVFTCKGESMFEILRSIKRRWISYLNRVIKFNEREFGTGSLSLATFDRINRHKD